MAIVKYTGQPLPAGTIICRHSMMRDGICSRPTMVVSEKPSTVVVRDIRDGDEVRRSKSGILYICDTVEEGERMFEASMKLVSDEQRISQEQAKDRYARKELAIDKAIEGKE